MIIHLVDKPLWREFDSQCNEMIITKIGRNLFPILEYSFTGLKEHQQYQIGISMIPTSRNKLKFVAGKWEPLECMEEVQETNEVLMPKFKTGRELMLRGLKLEKLKLTNTKDALIKNDQMIRVQSMRQYMPTLTVYEVMGMGELQIYGKYQFLETKFVAVTAYQSDSVKNLKVQRNKFAQGFREGSRAATKRPLSNTSSTSPSSTSTSSESSSDSNNTPKRNKLEPDPLPVYGFGTNLENFGNFGTSGGFDPTWTYQNYQYGSQNPIYNRSVENFGAFPNFPGQDLRAPNFYDYSNLQFGGYPWNG